MVRITPRGPLSAALLHALDGGDATTLRDLALEASDRRPLIDDDDVQLSLYLMYELHHGGLPGVDDDYEWHPDVLAARAVLEGRFETELRERFPVDLCEPAGLPDELFRRAAEDVPGASVPAYVARRADVDDVAEMLVLRSPYQLKEADPQTWAIPRLRGRAKAALVEIQIDEYGGGRADRMHAALFAKAMRALGLDDTPNAYLDHVPAVVLANANALTMFGLHRRLRGALCGHLAAFEMTSSLPARKVVIGMQRLELPGDAWEFFDEHVEADAVHEQVAARDLCGGLIESEPTLLPDVLLGSAVCLGMDALVGARTVQAWEAGRSALRTPLPDHAHSATVIDLRRPLGVA
ncbi:iron-containing redox enzyme family protein [Angustibacter aerolatus]